MTASIRFDGFELDAADRQLRRGGEPVELNGRYFDALALMTREPGRLITKDRFMDEVWRGVPVTDEALTQCIRTLRRQLGDDAARPRFIETVPKHGYRFIAPLEGARPAPAVSERDWASFVRLGIAGTLGGGAAGVVGGLFYGLLAAGQPGVAGVSILLVLLCLTAVIGLIGGAGVALGIAAHVFSRQQRWFWPIIGGAIGGNVVGAAVRLLGLDAFNLLFGQAPAAMTWALEGAILGAAVGCGYVLAGRQERLRIGAALAGLCGAAAGILIALAGLNLMGGSLSLLADHFPGSQLRLGGMFGESAFGPASETVTAALEGALFAACVVVAMLVARRREGPR